MKCASYMHMSFWFFCIRLKLYSLCSPSVFLCLSFETSLDGSDWSWGTTGFTLHKVQSVILVQNSVWRFACFASYIIYNVMSKNVFNLLLLETTLDDKSLSSIYRSAGTQFSKQELNNVFWISVHSMNSKRPWLVRKCRSMTHCNLIENSTNRLEISATLAKIVFLLPSRWIDGGTMVYRFFSPASSGLFCRSVLNARLRS